MSILTTVLLKCRTAIAECECLSRLQRACIRRDEAEVRQKLAEISEASRTQIYKYTYVLAQCPPLNDVSWGSEQACQDLARLAASTTAVIDKIMEGAREHLRQLNHSLSAASDECCQPPASDSRSAVGCIRPQEEPQSPEELTRLLEQLTLEPASSDNRPVRCVRRTPFSAAVQTRLNQWREQEPPSSDTERATRVIWEFLRNPNARSLTLVGMGLHTLPPIFDLPPFTKQLEQLDCSHNYLKELPTTLNLCVGLTRINYQDNPLSSPMLGGLQKKNPQL
jgi:hypothetical protein